MAGGVVLTEGEVVIADSYSDLSGWNRVWLTVTYKLVIDFPGINDPVIDTSCNDGKGEVSSNAFVGQESPRIHQPSTVVSCFPVSRLTP